MCGALMLKSSASTRMGLSTYASCLEVANWHRMGESAAHKHVPGHHASGVCRRECFACPDACACKQKSACPPKAEPVPARCDCGSGRTCTRRAQTPRAAPRAVHAPPRQTSACRWRGARRRGRRCWPHAHALPQPPAGVQGCAAGCGAPGGLGPAQRVDEIPGGGWVGWGGGSHAGGTSQALRARACPPNSKDNPYAAKGAVGMQNSREASLPKRPRWRFEAVGASQAAAQIREPVGTSPSRRCLRSGRSTLSCAPPSSSDDISPAAPAAVYWGSPSSRPRSM